MAATPPSNPGALVIDANVAAAISSREAVRDVEANAQLLYYAEQGYEWFAPGAIVTETLYALCRKYQAGLITPDEYAEAAKEFEILMSSIQPPSDGEVSLVQRAYEIANGYGCSRSADSVNIALAEELSLTRPTTLLTFDKELPAQAARNASTVLVELLTN